MELLQRRMKQFLGLHYNENTIESGVDRLDLGTIKFTKKDLTKLNQETISRSRNREELRERWNESLPLLEDMEVSNEVGVDKTFLPTVLLTDARKNFNLCASNRTDGTNHLYHPRFCEWTVPTLISSVHPVAYRVKYRLVEIFPIQESV